MNPFSHLYRTYLRIKNNLDYPLRQRFPLRSAPVTASHPDSRDILNTYPEKHRERVQVTISGLNNQYHFQYFGDTHTIDEIRENYYYLSMLDAAFQLSGIVFPEAINAADIGPSSWFYIHALSAVLRWYGTCAQRHIQLTGFEVDAYRLYSDFHTRKDHALGNMVGLQGVEYLDRGFEQQTNTYDVITLLFPFVFEKDHLEWGLPHRLFEPTALLKAAWNSLHPGGLLLIVNQGQEEHLAELRLLQGLGISPTADFHIEPVLYTYPLDRYIITAKHE